MAVLDQSVRSHSSGDLVWDEVASANGILRPILRSSAFRSELAGFLFGLGVLASLIFLIGADEGSTSLFQAVLIEARSPVVGGLLIGFGAILLTVIVLNIRGMFLKHQRREIMPAMMAQPYTTEAMLVRAIRERLDMDERVLWARRLERSGVLAHGAEVLTSKRLLQVVGGRWVDALWSQIDQATMTYSKGELCDLRAVAGYQEVRLSRCRSRTLITQILSTVLPVRGHSARPNMASSGEWPEQFSGQLANDEALLWVARPQQPYLLAIFERVRSLWNVDLLLDLIIGGGYAALFGFIFSMSFLDGQLTPVIIGVVAVSLIRLGWFVLQPIWYKTWYGITNRRVLQIRSWPLLGRAEVTNFFHLDDTRKIAQLSPTGAGLQGVDVMFGSVTMGLGNTQALMFRNVDRQSATSALPLLHSLVTSTIDIFEDEDAE